MPIIDFIALSKTHRKKTENLALKVKPLTLKQQTDQDDHTAKTMRCHLFKGEIYYSSQGQGARWHQQDRGQTQGIWIGKPLSDQEICQTLYNTVSELEKGLETTYKVQQKNGGLRFGTTLTGSLQANGKAYVFNLGDSSTFAVCRTDNGGIIVLPLTWPHHPRDKDEYKRIKKLADKAGLLIDQVITQRKGHTTRVNGLALSGVIGDTYNPYVTHEPSITIYSLDELEKKGYTPLALLHCSDGLTDAMNAIDIADYWTKNEKEWTKKNLNPAHELRKAAYLRTSKNQADNITVTLAPIHTHDGDQKEYAMLSTFIADGHGKGGEYAANYVQDNFPSFFDAQLKILGVKATLIHGKRQKEKPSDKVEESPRLNTYAFPFA